MQLRRIAGTALVTLWAVDQVKRTLNKFLQGSGGTPIPSPEVKILGTVAVASGLLAAQGVLDLKALALESVAVASLAGVLHDFQASASTSTDSNIAQVVSASRPRLRGPLS